MDLLDALIETAERIGRPRFAAPSLNYSTQNLRDIYLLERRAPATNERSRSSGVRASTACRGCRGRSTS
jgi:hypothetical protein